MKSDQDKYSTSTLSLAAAIIATTGIQPSQIEWQSQKAEIVFELNNSINSAVQAFWDKNLPCDCLTYFDALRSLKTRLHEEHYVG